MILDKDSALKALKTRTDKLDQEIRLREKL